MSPHTIIVDVSVEAREDCNELRAQRKASAHARAIQCLQEMCARDQGILTITPNGWRFSFPGRQL